MNQKTTYIVLVVLAVILLGLWTFNVRTTNDDTGEEATTTPTTEGTVTNSSQQQIRSASPTAPGDLVDGEYTIDSEESTIMWTGRKPRILGYEDMGTLELKSGSLLVSNGHVSSGEFFIDMESLTVTTTGRDEGTTVYGEELGQHLRSSDFFDVAAYPNASFTIRNVTNGTVTGDLTVKATTKTISFPATIVSESATYLHATANITLNRSLWDIRYGSDTFFDNLGDNLIADEVSIMLDLVATK